MRSPQKPGPAANQETLLVWMRMDDVRHYAYILNIIEIIVQSSISNFEKQLRGVIELARALRRYEVPRKELPVANKSRESNPKRPLPRTRSQDWIGMAWVNSTMFTTNLGNTAIGQTCFEATQAESQMKSYARPERLQRVAIAEGQLFFSSPRKLKFAAFTARSKTQKQIKKMSETTQVTVEPEATLIYMVRT